MLDECPPLSSIHSLLKQICKNTSLSVERRKKAANSLGEPGILNKAGDLAQWQRAYLAYVRS
jgi:hypothetical protein